MIDSPLLLPDLAVPNRDHPACCGIGNDGNVIYRIIMGGCSRSLSSYSCLFWIVFSTADDGIPRVCIWSIAWPEYARPPMVVGGFPCTEPRGCPLRPTGVDAGCGIPVPPFFRLLCAKTSVLAPKEVGWPFPSRLYHSIRSKGSVETGSSGTTWPCLSGRYSPGWSKPASTQPPQGTDQGFGGGTLPTSFQNWATGLSLIVSRVLSERRISVSLSGRKSHHSRLRGIPFREDKFATLVPLQLKETKRMPFKGDRSATWVLRSPG